MISYRKVLFVGLRTQLFRRARGESAVWGRRSLIEEVIEMAEESSADTLLKLLSECQRQDVLLRELAEDLRRAGTHADRPVVEDCFERLWSYIGLHFATEDRLMMLVSYPGDGHHRGEHDAAMVALRGLEQTCDWGHPDAARNLIAFIQSWLEKHLAEDEKLAAYVVTQLQSSVQSARKTAAPPSSE